MRMKVDIHTIPHEEKQRLRAAATKAMRLYPDPVGDVVARELHEWAEFGYRFGGKSKIMALADFLLRQSPPQPT
jgi:hypothetical protein